MVVQFGAISLGGTDESGEPLTIIGVQYPELIAGFEQGASKESMERYHIDRFAADYALRTGEPPWEHAIRGGEPPDFVVSRAGDTVRLDGVQFAFQEQRLGYRLFVQFRQRFEERLGEIDLTGLAGTHVLIHFGMLDRLPPKERDEEALTAALLASLDGASVDYDASAEVLAGGPPQVGDQLPPGVIATGLLPDGSAGFIANVLADPRSNPQIAQDRPLGLDLQMSRQLTKTSVTAMLQKAVDNHDKGSIDWLLFTAGGPDRDGWRYPGEEMGASFAISQGVELAATHIRRVSLHLWGSARTAELQVNVR
jgi:hypothetical protein